MKQKRTETQSSIPRQKIEHSMASVSSTRREYLNSIAQTGTVPDQLLREFHRDIVQYWIELRPYRESDAMGQTWDNAQLWVEDDQTVIGLDHLASWINRTRTATSNGPGRTGSTQTTVAPDTPSGAKLLRASMCLDDAARDLGIAIQPRRNRALGRVPHDEDEEGSDE